MIKRYKKWEEEDLNVLRTNYSNLSNKDLSIILNRTPDAIRKQLEKMELKREKVVIIKPPAKRGRKKIETDSLFSAINKGQKVRKELEKEFERRKKKEKPEEPKQKEVILRDGKIKLKIKYKGKTMYFTTSEEKKEDNIKKLNNMFPGCEIK